MGSREGKKSEVDNLEPDKITRNDDNPRIIFYENKMDILKNSIKDHGILVPLTVFDNGSKSKNHPKPIPEGRTGRFYFGEKAP